MMIKLELQIDEVNRLLALLGDQPIKSGFHDLTMKIKSQGEQALEALASHVKEHTPAVEGASYDLEHRIDQQTPPV